MNVIWFYLFRNLVLTILIEVIISLIIGVRDKKDILFIVLVNIVTNPIITIIPFIINLYCGIIMRRVVLIILELLTVFVEAIIYRKTLKFNKINCFRLSLILNACSYVIGIMINYF